MPSIREISKDAKAWPFIEAKKIIKRAQTNKKQTIRLQTGYGPSGLPHIGTFGEVARTTMILNAIKSISEIEVELIAFSDDMDGLRKVPDNVPNQNILSEHLHKPLTSIPDPFETSKSFGDYNNEMLQKFLDKFGFNYTFKSATELYTSGFFDNQLINVLNNYEIFEALIKISLMIFLFCKLGITGLFNASSNSGRLSMMERILCISPRMAFSFWFSIAHSKSALA